MFKYSLKKAIKKYMQIKEKQKHYLEFRRAQKLKIKKKTILFESLHAKSIDGHVFHLMKSLMKMDKSYKVYIVVRDIDKAKRKINNYNFEFVKNIKLVKHLSKEYGRLLATCEFLINDNTFYPFFSKRKGQKYFNIWHGTPLKTLGKDMGNPVGIANVQRNLLISDAIIVSNQYTKDIMVNAHNITNIYGGKVVIGPSPRNSPLFDNELEGVIREKYHLENKKIVMYMPTWRGQDGKVRSDQSRIALDLEYLSRNLDENTVLFFKGHTMQGNINIGKMNNVFDFPDEIELYDFLSCVDILVTDYSSIMYDFMNRNRKIILYTYDKDEYLNTRGTYENIDDYPFIQVNNIEDLANEINKDDYFIDYGDFKKRFCKYDCINGSDIIANYIFNNVKDESINEVSIYNNKENVFIFSGGLWDNGITTALLNNINAIDTNKRNYILVFGRSKVSKQHMFRLESLPETVLYYPIPGITIESLFERIIHKYYLKKEKFNFKWVRKLIEKIYEQELRRIFGDTKIDWFVHYTGFDRKYAEMVKYIPTKTVMFVHTDMFKDYENKKNYNKKVVYNAYRAATKIALVNENLKEGFKKNLPDLQNKLVVVNNFLGEDRIRKLSEENVISTLLEVKFDSVDSSHINVDPIKRYSELIKCCEQKYKNDYKQIKGLQIEFMEKSISNHIRTQIVNELSEKGVELAQIEKEIMMEINDKFKIINEDHIKEELLNTDVLKAYISNKMKEKYLNKNFEYRNKLISLLKEYTDVPVSTVDNILYKEIRNSEVKRLFPYFFTLLPLYIEAAGITSNELGGNNNCEGDGSSANISSINENSILDIIIDKFGISKMRMLNEILDPNITTFLNIGRYDLQKGHERLINAFEKFNYDYPDSRLIIIAPYGPIRNRTINRVKQSTAKKNIYLLGRMNNPYALLKMVDAFVLSSFYEGLGLVVYEALSLGTQVITVNLKTTTEYLKNNEAIVVDNSEDGIYNGLVLFKNGLRAKNKFDFDMYRNKSIEEFEGLFKNSF